jgi:hypothetical protein
METTKPKPPVQQKRRASKKPELLIDLFDENDEWLNTKGAAQLMVKTVATLRTMRSRGDGPNCTGSGHDTRYRKSDCLAWIQYHKKSADDLNK